MGSGPLVIPGQPTPMMAGDFAGASIPNMVSFGFSEVAPPSTIYVQRDDLLVVYGVSQGAANDTIRISVRMLLPVTPRPGQPLRPGEKPPRFDETLAAGTIQVVQADLFMPVPGQQYSTVVPLMEGYMLSAAIISLNQSVMGMTYVTAYLGRAPQGNTNPTASMLLMGDYTSTTVPAGWPNTGVRQPTIAQGVLNSITLANPGVGVGWAYTVPNGTRLRLLGVQGTFVTSATAATRDVQLQYLPVGAGLPLTFPTGITQAAGLSRIYAGGIGLSVFSDVATGSLASFPLPQMDMIGGGQIKAAITNIQVTDQWSNIQVHTMTWVNS